MSDKINFDKAMKILDLLLQGKPSKDIAFELSVTQTDVSRTKAKFPLLAGLVRRYARKAVDD